MSTRHNTLYRTIYAKSTGIVIASRNSSEFSCSLSKSFPALHRTIDAISKPLSTGIVIASVTFWNILIYFLKIFLAKDALCLQDIILRVAQLMPNRNHHQPALLLLRATLRNILVKFLKIFLPRDTLSTRFNTSHGTIDPPVNS